jgi:Phosphotransferase enzyme family
LRPDVARRCELIATRWLPAVGLQRASPQLFGAAPAQDGKSVWQVYEDLGDWGLNADNADVDQVHLAVELIARVHMAFADHPLLGECREYGDDFGIGFYAANVRDAKRALKALYAPGIHLTSSCAAVRDRLLDRLEELSEDQPRRAKLMADYCGPETLLHGDLWTSNTFVRSDAPGPRALLIDWDHVGVGPISYDLSTFVYRFRAEHRAGIVDLYRNAVQEAGWQLPGRQELNVLFDTAESARYANRAMWAALALLHEHAQWAPAELQEVEQWFEALEPAIP